MNRCVFCDEELTNGQQTVALGQKGVDGIHKVGDGQIHVEVGHIVHTSCRRNFCRRPSQSVSLQDQSANPNTCAVSSRRSTIPRFAFQEHCFLCGHPAKYNGRKKGFEVIPVRTFDFQKSIYRTCKERNDEWVKAVFGRIEFARDLHAVDAVYHQPCSINFRTGNQIPKQYASESSKLPRLGRPVDQTKIDAFFKVTEYLEQNEEEQITITSLCNKMQEYLQGSGEQAYSAQYMKNKLLEHFGNKVVITTMKNVANVVTFHRTATSIANEFYQQPKEEDGEIEKLRLVETAAKRIKNEISKLEVGNDNYPSIDEMSSLNQATECIPKLLKTFLSDIIKGKSVDLKLASLGQAITQAARPKGIIAPLQLGLAVQMHHHFASKFLIDSLHSHGFCSSYTRVHSFERNAAASRVNYIPGWTPGRFIQYAADNVDHNTRTLDGSGAFHGMGIIATVTPVTKSTQKIPKRSVTNMELSATGAIPIIYYKGSSECSTLSYKDLENLQVQDPTANLDLLFKLSLLLFWAPRPAWSGAMQMVCEGAHPGQSSVSFLPMIDMDPSNMTYRMYSTLHFKNEHAKRYQVTAIVTFDQPLWWKALMIVLNEPSGSDLGSIILRLGGLHIEMSFLGSIGHLMGDSGIKEVLELVYSNNAVGHMLSGKAIARAIRGHFLVDAALNALLVSSTFDIPMPVVPINEISEAEHIEADSDAGESSVVASRGEETGETESNAQEDIEISPMQISDAASLGQENEETESNTQGHPTATDDDIESARLLYRQLVNGNIAEKEGSAEVLSKISEQLENKRKSMKNHRTAVLWLQYMKMVDILRKFLKAERTGNWELHLQSVRNMLPFFAAAGHHLYAKSAYAYLQRMKSLKKDHPHVYSSFQNCLHVVRRSDRYWAGLPTDLAIEQVLMRNVKTSGGLTRGRGFTEMQRLIWVMSMPICAEINNAIQTLTNINYQTSEQHKDLSRSRQDRVFNDTKEIITYLSSRNPFSGDKVLRSISTGVISNEQKVNVDKAEEVGESILKSMKGKFVQEYKFRKKDQAVTLATKTSVSIKGKSVQVDPQLLFQRLSLIAISGRFVNTKELFKYEMCSFPTALFDSSLLPRKANKPALADAVWTRMKHTEMKVPTEQAQYVLDGGALLPRVPWPRGLTYGAICDHYTQYVGRRYGTATIVFDGYEAGSSTKDCTHMRRTTACGPTVNFEVDMIVQSKKEEFIANKANTQAFINLLGSKLRQAGHTVLHSPGDADLDIVLTSVRLSRLRPVVLVGDDTDLLVLLYYHADLEAHDVFFKPEPKSQSQKRKVWNIKKVKSVLGTSVCQNILFLHAILGCDTTSHLQGIGKGTALKKFEKEQCFQEQAKMFDLEEATKEEITMAGENALLYLYNGANEGSLDSLRYSRFCQRVATGSSSLQPENLPPTSAAAASHSLRVYFQVMDWKGPNQLKPEDWGWEKTGAGS